MSSPWPTRACDTLPHSRHALTTPPPPLCVHRYHIGNEIEDRTKLNVATPASLKAKLNLEVRVRSEVTAIDTASKTVTVKDLSTGNSYSETYDELVLSLGAKPFLPPIPGIGREGNLALRNLEDMDRIIARISGAAAKTAVVAGALNLPTLPTCLPASYLPTNTYLPTCLPTHPPTYLPTYLPTHLRTCLLIYLLIYLRTYVRNAYPPTCLPACLP